jgi:hypothetical protein
MAEKFTRQTHKIAIRLHLAAESRTHLQFSFQAAIPETFGYTLLSVMVNDESGCMWDKAVVADLKACPSLLEGTIPPFSGGNERNTRNLSQHTYCKVPS